MPEIAVDRSDPNRCLSVHWSLPVQCVLPSSHRENWHEAWHPESGNRLRYRRSYGNFRTEDLHHGEWHDLKIPPPGGFCGLMRSDRADVRCTEQYGHGWTHRAVVDGVRHTGNTLPPKGLSVDQLTRDVQQLRGMLVAAHSRIAELERPDEERRRAQIRSSYTELIAQAEQDRDHEGAAVVQQQLREREAVWAREDALAKEFATDPLALNTATDPFLTDRTPEEGSQ
jgi:hypothetical protein